MNASMFPARPWTIVERRPLGNRVETFATADRWQDVRDAVALVQRWCPRPDARHVVEVRYGGGGIPGDLQQEPRVIATLGASYAPANLEGPLRLSPHVQHVLEALDSFTAAWPRPGRAAPVPGSLDDEQHGRPGHAAG